MNRLLIGVFLLFAGFNTYAQTKVSGTVKDALTGDMIYNLTATLIETGEAVRTDRIGYFQFLDIQDGSYTLRIEGEAYETSERLFSVSGENVDLGEILVKFNPTMTAAGIITLSDEELSDDESSSQSSVSLLQSSRDVFARAAAFDLGAYWFKVRGYDNRYNDVFFNGIKMNKMDNGRATFNNWGGLNDITRYPEEITYGLEASSTAFGNVGGVTNFDTRPSTLRKGVSLSYSQTNRSSYRSRIMATYNTGLMDNGWGLTFSGSRRWANEGRIDGTLNDAWAYYLGIEKKINDKHTLNFTAFGAPNRRATNAPNTKEVFDLKGIQYNSYWGWHNGDRRNERIRETHEPIAMLTHHWTINPKSRLTTSVAYQFGHDNGTRLDWSRANNPSPVYYRNLPSYLAYNGATEDEIQARKDLWRNGQEYSQINWASIYQQNYLRSQAGEHAAYVLAEDHIDRRTLSASTNFRTQLTEDIEFVVAGSFQRTEGDYYRKVKDLLGGTYFINTDDYADFGTSGQYDERNPNRIIYKGDKYEYDYEITKNYGDLFFQAKMDWDVLTWTVGMTTAYTGYTRDGKYQHYMYPENSYGKSERHDFYDFGIKSNMLFKIDGRNFISANFQYSSIAPNSNGVFANSRSNNLVVPNLESEKIIAGELNYILRAPRIKGKATAFYTLSKDGIEKTFGYIDAGGSSATSRTYFAAETLTNVEKQYLGGEIAVEANITPTVTLTGVASIGQYTYNNNPDYHLFTDDEPGGYKYFGKTHLKDYRLAEGPQQGYSLGLEYRDPHYWWIGLNANLLIDNYFDVAPYSRTNDFTIDPTTIDPITGEGEVYENMNSKDLRRILRQYKASNEFMLNLNMGKTFRFGQYFVGLSMTINNLLNNKDYVTSGFEQMRGGDYNKMLDDAYRSNFGPKMWYDQGRTIFFNMFVRF